MNPQLFWDQSCALKVVGSKWKDKCLSPSKYHGEGMAAIARTIWWRRPSAPQQQPRRPRSTKWNRATSRPHECCPPWVKTQHQQKTQHSDTGVHLPQPSSDLLTNLVAKAQALLAGEMMWPEKKRNLQALTSRGGKGGITNQSWNGDGLV